MADDFAGDFGGGVFITGLPDAVDEGTIPANCFDPFANGFASGRLVQPRPELADGRSDYAEKRVLGYRSSSVMSCIETCRI